MNYWVTPRRKKATFAVRVSSKGSDATGTASNVLEEIMFAAIVFVSLLGFGNTNCEAEAVAAPVIQSVFEEARHDFELRHAELGLLGAAPLPVVEQAEGN